VQKAKWKPITTDPNPLGEVPVVPVPNNPSLLRGGKSETIIGEALTDGRRDRVLPFAQTQALPGNAALHALDDCGHMPHLEQPTLSLRILTEVWRSAG